MTKRRICWNFNACKQWKGDKDSALQVVCYLAGPGLTDVYKSTVQYSKRRHILPDPAGLPFCLRIAG